ncbi:MAG: hypothetical protein ACXWXK_05720 [Actinomycetota bacterium]
MSARLPNQLHDLASEMPVDVEASRTATLRRARRRRGASALLAVAAVAGLVIGGVAGIDLLTSGDGRGRIATPPDQPTPTAGVSPQPAAFPGLWPETDEDALAANQAAIDEGHQPLRVDPAQTAAMLVTDVFDWPAEALEPRVTRSTGTFATVDVLTAAIDRPPFRVTLAQLGRTGPTGIWTVIGVASDLLDVRALERTADGVIAFEGNVLEPVDGGSVAFDVVDQTDPVAEFESGFEALTGTFFEIEVPTAGDIEPRVLWVALRDDSDRILAGAALPLRDVPPVPTPTASTSPEIGGVEVPAVVAETYNLILEAAPAHDIDALRALLDPDTFVYGFDDGSDPTPAWREDPSVLDAIPGILQLPFTVIDIDGYGTFYQWPYLVEDGALDEVSMRERDDLHALGFSDREIEQMREYGGYLGPRLSIDADGLWRNYILGGD